MHDSWFDETTTGCGNGDAGYEGAKEKVISKAIHKENTQVGIPVNQLLYSLHKVQ